MLPFIVSNLLLGATPLRHISLSLLSWLQHNIVYENGEIQEGLVTFLRSQALASKWQNLIKSFNPNC